MQHRAIRCINRNILECKDRSVHLIELSDYVLIETYWNVKVGKPLPFKNHFESINRNILECKDYLRYSESHSLLRINRNILECKVVYSQMRIRPAIGINRNILECKDKY